MHAMSTRSVKPDVLRPSILGMQEFMVLQPTAAHGNYPTLTHALILRPGRWLGKAFSSRSSEGYNLFYPGRTAPPSKGSLDKEGFPDGTLRERFFGFSPFVDSVYGSGASSELDYGRGGNNGPLFGGMRDEVGSRTHPLHTHPNRRLQPSQSQTETKNEKSEPNHISKFESNPQRKPKI